MKITYLTLSLLAIVLTCSISARSENTKVLIHFQSNTMEELQERISESEGLGIRVIHIYPPSSIIGETANSTVVSTLLKDAEVVTDGSVIEKSSSQSRIDATEVWNYFIEHNSWSDPDALSGLSLRHDEPSPPEIPSELIGEWEGFSRQFTIGNTFTSNHMTGRVAVKIALMESSGSSENWGVVYENRTIAEIAQGLDWLSASAASRGIKLQWVYDISRAVPTDYEPIQEHSVPYYSVLLPPLSWEFLWIEDALRHFGFSQEEWAGCFALAQNLRQTYYADWAFSIFVVMDNNDPDHSFESGSPNASVMPYYDWTGTLFRKLPGCVVTMTYNNGNWEPDRMDLVVSHEVGHIFRAPDEYAQDLGGCNAWDDCVDDRHYGYLYEVNGNCDECVESVPCVMLNNSHTFCPFTLGHNGWRDNDVDQVADALKLNNGPWEIIPDLHLGDIVRFYTFEELDFVNSFAVSPDRFFQPNPIDGWTVWDSHNYDGQPVAVTHFYYTVNDGSLNLIIPNPSNPSILPQFANVSYQNDTLQWTLQTSWANVRCFIYDNNMNLVSRPVWDKLLASSSVTKLDMRLLSYE